MDRNRCRLLLQWMAIVLASIPLASCGGGDSGDTAVATVFTANRIQTDTAFTATLSGAQAIPANTSLAAGAGTVLVDSATRLLKVSVTTSGIAATSVWLQDAQSAAAGSIVFALVETASGSGIWITQNTLSEVQLAALRNGNYFLTAQSAAFPAGEIRGQILPRLSTPFESGIFGVGTTAAATSTATVFKNALTGSQVVPPVSTAATGLGTAAVDQATKTLTLAVNTLGLTGTEAHVHSGDPGLSGPIVFALRETIPGSGIWAARVTLTEAQFNTLMAGNYYFDVHSAGFPAGELRGQIAQLQRATRVRDCRFGGFGFDDCSFDGSGAFIGLGFGLGGIGLGAFDTGSAGFDGFQSFDGSDGGASGVPFDSGNVSSDTPAPGIFF